jgi:hypothetical protein
LFYGNGDGTLGPRIDLPLGSGLIGLQAARKRNRFRRLAQA